MAKGLRADEGIRSGVRRATARELRRAASRLEVWAADPVANVHEARRRVKRARAWIRLGDDAALAEALGRVARRLGRVRDGDALAALVAILPVPDAGGPPRVAVRAARGAVATWRRRTGAGIAVDEVRRTARRLRALSERAAGTAAPRGAAALVVGLRRAYARLRAAHARAARRDDVETFHALRRRMKDLLHQHHLLRRWWSRTDLAWYAVLEELGDRAGEAQDLRLLADAVRSASAAGASGREALLRWLNERAALLRSAVVADAGPLLAARPRRFADDIRAALHQR